MQILEGHTDDVPALAFSPDGSLLASVGNDRTTRLWQFPDGAERNLLPRPRGHPPCLAFSPDGRWLAAPDLDNVWVRDLSNPRERIQLPLTEAAIGEAQKPYTVAFSPGGSRLLLSGQRHLGGTWQSRRGVQAMARSWTVGAWTALPDADFAIPSAGVWLQPWALTPHGPILATPYGQSVVFWDFASGTELFRVTGKSCADPTAATFTSDGKRFAIARATSIVVYDVVRREELASLRNPTPKHVRSLAFSPDGRTLITVSNDAVARLWDVETGREKAALAWGAGQLKAVAFAPDGMRAAASGKRGTIVVWDID